VRGECGAISVSTSRSVSGSDNRSGPGTISGNRADSFTFAYSVNGSSTGSLHERVNFQLVDAQLACSGNDGSAGSLRERVDV
jgi:hypothetical protein